MVLKIVFKLRITKELYTPLADLPYTTSWSQLSYKKLT